MLGFFVIIPMIITFLLSDYIVVKFLDFIYYPYHWFFPQSLFNSNLEYYFYAFVSELIGLFIIGVLIAPYDDQIDRFIKKIPGIGSLYSKVNDFFSTKKRPKGVPIVLNIYGSEWCNVVCFIPSFQKRWLYVTQRKAYCWCYTFVPPPNGNPIGGHDEHCPCDIIDQEMINQYANMTFDELIVYCVSFGMSFPDRLTQQSDEDMPAWIVEKLKLDAVTDQVSNVTKLGI